MKFCPHCGTSTPKGLSASFCMDCGNKLPSGENASKPVQNGPHETNGTAENPATQPASEQAISFSESNTANAPVSKHIADEVENVMNSISNEAATKLNERREQRKRRPEPAKKTKSTPPPEVSEQETGYDGYYRDIVPSDSGYIREKMDPGLIKRVILVAVGAAVLVGLSIVLMYYL